MKQFGFPPPFALFFPLAALDAFLVGGGWIAALSPFSAGWTIQDAAKWHQGEFLFGFVTAALAGFLLTALPRWTDRPLAKGSSPTFLGCWIAARFASVHPAPFAQVVAAPGLLLALIAAFHVWRARDGRNVKAVMLLALYASAGIVGVSADDPQRSSFSINLAIAAIVGLIVLIAGRIIPALTLRFDELCGGPAAASLRGKTDHISAALVAVGLGCWLLAPESAYSGPLLMAAGLSQAWRMTSWFGRRTLASPPLLALYAAYAAIPIGFGLQALHALLPGAAPGGAGLHVWTMGGFGGMIMTVMASMIRKRRQRAFAPSVAAETAVALCLGATVARVAAAFAGEPRIFLTVAALMWPAGFALFLFAFRAPLFEAAVKRGSATPPRNRQKESRP